MANKPDTETRLKRKPSLQRCVDWLTKRKSFASLVEKTAQAASQRRATSPIREDFSSSRADASPRSTRPSSPSSIRPAPPTPTSQRLSPLARPRGLSRAAGTPPPQLDVHISTSPIDWSSPALTRPKPFAALAAVTRLAAVPATAAPVPAAAAAARVRRDRPLPGLPLSMTTEELDALREEARDNIRERALAAIAASNAVLALGLPDWATALDDVATAADEAAVDKATTDKDMTATPDPEAAFVAPAASAGSAASAGFAAADSPVASARTAASARATASARLAAYASPAASAGSAASASAAVSASAATAASARATATASGSDR